MVRRTRTALLDSATITALISGAVAVTVAALTAGATYVLTRRREQEAEWRKLKLERYTEYVAALSGVVQRSNVTSEARARYAHAINSITLVAPPTVLTALYAFQDELADRNVERTSDRAHELLSDLLSAIRRDIDPGDRQQAISVRFMSAPPPPLSHPDVE